MEHHNICIYKCIHSLGGAGKNLQVSVSRLRRFFLPVFSAQWLSFSHPLLSKQSSPPPAQRSCVKQATVTSSESSSRFIHRTPAAAAAPKVQDIGSLLRMVARSKCQALAQVKADETSHGPCGRMLDPSAEGRLILPEVTWCLGSRFADFHPVHRNHHYLTDLDRSQQEKPHRSKPRSRFC